LPNSFFLNWARQSALCHFTPVECFRCWQYQQRGLLSSETAKRNENGKWNYFAYCSFRIPRYSQYLSTVGFFTLTAHMNSEGSWRYSAEKICEHTSHCQQSPSS
jgi:hypothetical protein